MATFPRLKMFEPGSADPEWGRLVISAYDHYIGRDEAPPIPYDFRESPRLSQAATRYAEAEQAFWRLHLRLAEGGVLRVRGERHLEKVSAGGRRFKDLWFQSHRALKGRGESGFLELFYPRLSLRVRHGWDLTDHSVCGDQASSGEVSQMVAEAGLYVLPGRPSDAL